MCVCEVTFCFICDYVEMPDSGTAFVCWGATKPNGGFDMLIVMLILLFCGTMLLLDRMLCGFVEKMSNSKKMRK